MSENIEKIETSENTETTPGTQNNVVPYPFSNENTSTENVLVENESTEDASTTNDKETSNNQEIANSQETAADYVNNTNTSAGTASSAAASHVADNFAHDTNHNTNQDSIHDNIHDNTDDGLEEDFYEQQESTRSKDEHPFREFFSNFRSKRKIEMNRDEQILSRISDDDLMEYLHMEQKRMELLQQAKETREKRFWTTFQLLICLLSVVLVIYFLKDNPVILVTILYTFGILAALRIWSKSQNRKDSRDTKDSKDYHKKPWE